MRVTLPALALALVPFVLSIPVDSLARRDLEARDHLFRPSADPMAIHKRSTPADAQERSDASSSSSSSSAANVAKRQPVLPLAEEEDEPCADICTKTWVVQSNTHEDALCSPQGLKATLQCARCIDQVWPETSWEDSALAEYERIKSACAAGPQSK